MFTANLHIDMGNMLHERALTCAPVSCLYLGNELKYLSLRIWWSKYSKSLQPPQTALDLPLLFLQRQVAISNQRLIPLHFLWGAGVSLSPAVHHPAMLHLLNTHNV